MHAIGLKLGHIALRGRIGPHFTVHGRGHEQGHFVDRARQTHQTEQVVGAAMQELGQKIGTGRRHQNGVGLAAQIDVRHVVGFTGIPLRGVDGTPRQGLHGHRSHKVFGRVGHHHLHARPGFDQRTAQLSRFKASNAARESQNQMFSSQCVHAGQCSRPFLCFIVFVGGGLGAAQGAHTRFARNIAPYAAPNPLRGD